MSTSGVLAFYWSHFNATLMNILRKFTGRFLWNCTHYYHHLISPFNWPSTTSITYLIFINCQKIKTTDSNLVIIHNSCTRSSSIVEKLNALNPQQQHHHQAMNAIILLFMSTLMLWCFDAVSLNRQWKVSKNEVKMFQWLNVLLGAQLKEINWSGNKTWNAKPAHCYNNAAPQWHRTRATEINICRRWWCLLVCAVAYALFRQSPITMTPN